MEIIQIPQNYASLNHPLIYTATDATPRTFDVQVVESDSGETVGVKRLIGTSRASVDVAPYLRSRLFFNFFEPHGTGFVSAAGRTVVSTIQIDSVRSPLRTFVPATHDVVPPALLTTLCGSRIIARGECDELTLCTAIPCVARVTAYKGALADTTVYTAPHAGFVLFRLDTTTFPGATVIRVQIDEVGSISYYLTEQTAGCRLAWRSSAGSVEHYTFPVEKEANDEVKKVCILTRQGYRAVAVSSERLTTLISAYEPQRVLASLEEILSSPAVWRVDNGIYTPVDVVNDHSGVHRHGTLRNLEVQLRSQPKTLLP